MIQPSARAFDIRHELRPGDLGMVIHLHGVLYAREYGLDTTFEPYVAKPLADFVLAGAGRLWIAEEDGRVVGSIAVVDADEGVGQLRWFLLTPEARGTGLGRRMLDTALAYCRARGMHRVYGVSRNSMTPSGSMSAQGFKSPKRTRHFCGAPSGRKCAWTSRWARAETRARPRSQAAA